MRSSVMFIRISLVVRLTNNRLRKSPTSSVVAGPPMFINTIAVGPLLPAVSCMTGGAIVAIVRSVSGCRVSCFAGHALCSRGS